MARRVAHLMLSIASVASAASGCGASAPSRFYTLDATAVPDGAAPVSYPIMVGAVSVPAAVDRPEFVVQTALNRVDVDEFNRWPRRAVKPSRKSSPATWSSCSGRRTWPRLRWRTSSRPIASLSRCSVSIRFQASRRWSQISPQIDRWLQRIVLALGIDRATVGQINPTEHSCTRLISTGEPWHCLESVQSRRRWDDPLPRQLTIALAIDPPNAVQSTRVGHAGGLMRARTAIRAADGTFLSQAKVEAIVAERAERGARGGRARAATALRAVDGTLLPSN